MAHDGQRLLNSFSPNLKNPQNRRTYVASMVGFLQTWLAHQDKSKQYDQFLQGPPRHGSTRPYKALQGPTRPFQGPPRPYKALQDPTRPCKALQAPREGLTRP